MKAKMTPKDKNSSYQVSMGSVFLYSLFVHAVIFILGVVGLPHMQRELVIPQPISIELAMVDDVVKTKKPPKDVKKPAPKKEEPEKPVKTPPRALSQTLTQDEPKKEEAKKEEKKVDPKPEPRKAPEKKPEIKPEPKKEPKPEPKKETPKKEEPKADPFASMLKNLAPDEEKSTPEVSQQGEISQVITADELSAVRKQLTACWNLLPGARDADKLSVELRIKVFPDRTVQSVEVIDTARYKGDPFFRAAADNAVRAVRNPACNPLNLPVNKYALWKDIIFNFDPRGMF